MSIDLFDALTAASSALQQSYSVSLRTIGVVMIVTLGILTIRGRKLK